MASKKLLLAVLFGVLLVAAPVIRAEEYDDDEDDEGKGGSGGSDDEKDVVVITQKNFDDVVKKSKFALVEFYAPWCGHCKSLAPHYAKAATQLKEYDASIVIGKVDATVESDLASKFGISGYPTLKWFIDGEVASDYNGGRDTEGIIKWVKRKTGPFAVTVDSTDKLASMEKESPVIVLGFFKSFDGAEYEAFKTVGIKIEDVAFAQTTDAAVAKAAGASGKAPAIVAIKNHKGEEREVATLAGSITADPLTEFINGEKLPLSIEFNNENSEKIFNSGISKQLILWTGQDQLEASSPVFQAFRATSKKFQGKLVFVTVNKDGDAHEPVTNYFGLKDAKAPVVMGFYMEKNRKYRFQGDAITEASLAEFAESVVDGTAEPEYKSAPIPDEPEDEGVTIVVGKNFDAIVKDAKKDVLLEVYAPWCGHCKKLEPIYKKLAKRFKKVDSVVIAKMDGTENEHPDVDVKGFPTILFFPAGEDKEVVVFDGDRTLKGFTKFLKSSAKVAFELPKKGGDDEGESAAKDSTKDEL